MSAEIVKAKAPMILCLGLSEASSLKSALNITTLLVPFGMSLVASIATETGSS
jgi:hypothetical protein